MSSGGPAPKTQTPTQPLEATEGKTVATAHQASRDSEKGLAGSYGLLPGQSWWARRGARAGRALARAGGVVADGVADMTPAEKALLGYALYRSTGSNLQAQATRRSLYRRVLDWWGGGED